MPAEREQQSAFGPPTGLWPGQDVPRQSDIPRQQAGPVLPWPEATASAPTADGTPTLPWPAVGDQAAGPIPGQRWPTTAGPVPGQEWAADPADVTRQEWAADPSTDATWPGWAAEPSADVTRQQWAADAAWPDGPTTGYPGGPVGPVPPGGDGPDQTGSIPPPPGAGSPRRWRLAVTAAVALAVVGGGGAVAALRPEPGTPRAGTPRATAPAGAPAPGSTAPGAEEGLGDRPSASSSASADSGGFSGTRLTLPGASIGVQNGETFGQALARSDRTFGRLRMARVFFPGLPPRWKGSRADVVDRTVVVSFKASPQDINSGRYDSRLASWFASIPRDQNVYWSYFHEPEDDVERGAFTTAAYRTAWKRIAGLADRADNPKLISTLILMCWTLDPKSGRDFDAFYPGGDVIETLGWDCYNWGVKWKRYASPQEIYGRMIDKSEELGKPWGVAETGSDLVPGDSGAGRAAWIRSMTGYLNKQRPEFVAYYNQVVSQGDFRLLDQPSIQAWRSFCLA